MSTIQEIETAIAQLSPEQLADFRVWFAEFEAQRPPQPAFESSVAEQVGWHQLAAQNLAAAYGDDEPEYTVADLQKPNPMYRAG